MNHCKKGFLVILLCACLILSSCTGQMPTSTTEPTLTLPPVEQSYAAPIGDASLEYFSTATFYLPRYDSNLLGAFQAQVPFSAARPDTESLVRALLNQPETGTLSSLGGNVKLALYGVNPVEQSRNVVTVNLAASALQMDRRALYIACQAITNTLTELPDIDYVNFLVVDRAIGLDVANTLPMGTFSRSVGVDIGNNYDQLMLRRVDVTQSATEKPLASDVTLYFPLAHTAGVLSEVRNCSFHNQVTEDMIVVLLQELALGSQENIQTPALPLLADLLVSQPIIEETEESGKMIVLDFAYNLDEMLAANQISRANCMASLCYTLCTYFPGISGIHVSIDGVPIDTVMLTDQLESSVSFPNQVQKRSDYATLLCDLCRIYLPENADNKLLAISRPVPYYYARHPRLLLQELAKGPQAYDLPQTSRSVMTDKIIDDAAIIGLALADKTLLVNLSASFEKAYQGSDGQQERLLVYAIVNTLCWQSRAEKVQFFVNGKPFSGFTGELFWETSFAPMH
ncbi:MAG: GerMN domain-containing protein [Clostridia bacterium]|nr:GerMN domain-containing protein [Clostridia bacterium]